MLSGSRATEPSGCLRDRVSGESFGGGPEASGDVEGHPVDAGQRRGFLDAFGFRATTKMGRMSSRRWRWTPLPRTACRKGERRRRR